MTYDLSLLSLQQQQERVLGRLCVFDQCSQSCLLPSICALQAREATLAYTAIAKKHGLTPTELALAWCRSRCAWEQGRDGRHEAN